MYDINEGECQEARRTGRIPQELEHLHEGRLQTKEGESYRGVTTFNVPIGEDGYVAHVLKNKAEKVRQLAREYTTDLEEENPHKLWTMLQLSLHHRVTYWLRTCTPEETEEMARMVDGAIMEGAQAATIIYFEQTDAAKDKSRVPARIKGGGIKRLEDVRYPTFLGALLEILPRCIDRKKGDGEIERGCYSEQLTDVIGAGAYDATRHRN
jgi:hypothetical protein